MQFTTLTVVFLFFDVVLTTAINPVPLDNSGITKRSMYDGRSTDTSLAVQGYSSRDSGISLSKSPASITQIMGKRNDHRQKLIEVLGVMTPYPVRIEKSGLVYNLHRSLYYRAAAVKIIYLGKDSVNRSRRKKEVQREAIRLLDVGQLWGWGRTEDGRYHYFIMPYLGVAWNRVTPALTEEKALKLMRAREGRYLDEYGIIYKGKSLDQCVFMAQGNGWVANLVDWSQGTSRAGRGYGKEMKTPPKSFIIYSQDKVYRPPPEIFEHFQI